MIKIKFIRIENVVLMKVLEQDGIKRGCGEFYEAKNGITLRSSEFPEINFSHIYVRGNSDEKDNNVGAYEFNDTEDAVDRMRRFIEAIKEYNASCGETVSDYTDDIETVIAE